MSRGKRDCFGVFLAPGRPRDMGELDFLTCFFDWYIMLGLRLKDFAVLFSQIHCLINQGVRRRATG